MITVGSTHGRLIEYVGNLELINEALRRGDFEEARSREREASRVEDLTIRTLGRNAVATGKVTQKNSAELTARTVSRQLELMHWLGYEDPTKELINGSTQVTRVCSKAVGAKFLEAVLLQEWERTPNDSTWDRRWNKIMSSQREAALLEHADAHSTSVIISGVSRGTNYAHGIIKLLPKEIAVPSTEQKSQKSPILDSQIQRTRLEIVAGHLIYFEDILNFVEDYS